mmetsp:Transcript_79381/g.157825  ORF Transcript_79381/g.157825 Transcript_79381/m.157825 type:complete len:209 (+) Transcript_79381:127-753(+)
MPPHMGSTAHAMRSQPPRAMPVVQSKVAATQSNHCRMLAREHSMSSPACSAGFSSLVVTSTELSRRRRRCAPPRRATPTAAIHSIIVATAAPTVTRGDDGGTALWSSSTHPSGCQGCQMPMGSSHKMGPSGDGVHRWKPKIGRGRACESSARLRGEMTISFSTESNRAIKRARSAEYAESAERSWRSSGSADTLKSWYRADLDDPPSN